jgi:hypothetical protein
VRPLLDRYTVPVSESNPLRVSTTVQVVSLASFTYQTARATPQSGLQF